MTTKKNTAKSDGTKKTGKKTGKQAAKKTAPKNKKTADKAGDEGFVISDFHFEEAPVRERDPRRDAKMPVYAAYTLTVVTFSLLLLVSAVPGFTIIALGCISVALAIIFDQLFISENHFYRGHFRYCFKTVIYGALMNIASLVVILGSYRNIILQMDPPLPLDVTILFEYHLYLFWSFLPAFFYVILRTFKGWQNIPKPQLPQFEDKKPEPPPWAEDRIFIYSYVLMLAAAPLMITGLAGAAITGMTMLVFVFLANCGVMLVQPLKKDPVNRPHLRHIVNTAGTALLMIAGCTLLVRFAQGYNLSILYIFAKGAISPFAMTAAETLHDYLRVLQEPLIFSLAALFLLYRSFDILGQLHVKFAGAGRKKSQMVQ